MAGLSTAQELIDEFSEDTQQKHLLSFAILGIWSFGEYAIKQLEQYRLKASHRGYTKNRSVHYSRNDVRNCLDSMLELKDEVASLLRTRGKL